MTIPTRPEWVSWKGTQRIAYLAKHGISTTEFEAQLLRNVDEVIRWLFLRVEGRDLVAEYGGKWEQFLDAHDHQGYFPPASHFKNAGSCIQAGYYWNPRRHACFPGTPEEPETPEEMPDPWVQFAYEVLTQAGGKFPRALTHFEANAVIQEADKRLYAQPIFTEAKFAEFVEQVYNERYAEPGPPIPEITIEHWEAQGYTDPQAAHIAKWCRANKMTPSPSTIGKLLAELEAPVETPLKKAWREFAAKPDIVTALGLLPSSTIESFSRVFTGYSYIDGKPADPRTGDYVAVGTIIAGLTLAGAATVYTALAAMPAVGAGGMMKGTATASLHVEKSVLMTWATKIVLNPFFKLLTGISFIFMAFWNLTDPIWWQASFVKMSGDSKKRFEGLRIDVETKMKQAYNLLHISPTAATRAEALRLLRASKPLINDLFNILSQPEIDTEIRQKYPEFENQVRAFIIQFNDLVKLAGGATGDYLKIEEMLVEIPEIPPLMPEDIFISNVKVIDGDTIEWPGHHEFMNAVRFAGMDAHEIGTTSGKNEAEYLRSLIEGRTILIKINPLAPSDTYGRLIGVPYLDGVNIVHVMLAKFGKEILGSKYKHKFVDWDENTRIAKGEVAPEVAPGVEPPVEIKPVFKIYIDSMPTRAKLYVDGTYTHHMTPSDEKELKDVMELLKPGKHILMATKAGKSAMMEAEITEGDNGRIILELETVGLARTREDIEKEIAKARATLDKLEAELKKLGD